MLYIILKPVTNGFVGGATKKRLPSELEIVSLNPNDAVGAQESKTGEC